MDALEVSRAASARELQEHTRDSAPRATAFRFERASLRPRLLLRAMAASSSPDWRPSRPPYPARPPAVVSQIAEKFSESTAAGLARDVVRALAHCHAHGVIHRDIKVGRSRSSRASRFPALQRSCRACRAESRPPAAKVWRKRKPMCAHRTPLPDALPPSREIGCWRRSLREGRCRQKPAGEGSTRQKEERRAIRGREKERRAARGRGSEPAVAPP